MSHYGSGAAFSASAGFIRDRKWLLAIRAELPVFRMKESTYSDDTRYALRRSSRSACAFRGASGMHLVGRRPTLRRKSECLCLVASRNEQSGDFFEIQPPCHTPGIKMNVAI
jgi:hypothetical protein